MQATAYAAFPHSADFVHTNSVFAFDSDFGEMENNLFQQAQTQYRRSNSHMLYDDLRRCSNDSYEDGLFQYESEHDAHVIQKANALERFISQNVQRAHDFSYSNSRSSSPNTYSNTENNSRWPQPYHVRHTSEPSISHRQPVSSAPCSPTGHCMEDSNCQPLRLIPLRRPSFQLKPKKRRDSQTLPRPFACPVDNCQRRYEAWRSLQYHLKANHNIVSRRINGTIQVEPVPDTADPQATARQLEKVFNDLYDVLCPPGSNGLSISAAGSQSPTGMSGVDIKINSPLASPLSAPENNTSCIPSLGGRNTVQRSHSHSFGDSYENGSARRQNYNINLGVNNVTEAYPMRSRSYNFTSPLSSSADPLMEFVGANTQPVKRETSWEDTYAVNSPDVPVDIDFNNNYENFNVNGEERISVDELYTELVSLVGGNPSRGRTLSANMYQ